MNVLKNPLSFTPSSCRSYPKLQKEIDISDEILEKINHRLKNSLQIKDKTIKPSVQTITKESDINKLSRFAAKKNYYHKPSFPDMQYEENEYLSHTSHSGSEISEWNIDGLAEGQIYSKLHEMGIAITAHKIKDINKIIQQNNYTNQLLHVVSNQINQANKKSTFNKPESSKNIKMETSPKWYQSQVRNMSS